MTDPFNSTTHGPKAKRTTETDFHGRAFGVDERGAIVTGTVTSGIFTPDATTGTPTYRVDRVQLEADGVLQFCGVADTQREAFATPFYVATAAGSTTSAIKIDTTNAAIPNVSATANHILHILDSGVGPARPGYLVSSVTGGDTINLVSAMSETAPGAGHLCILIAKRKLLPNASDFTLPAFGFKVGANWFVLEPSTGKIWRATAGTDLAKVASGSGACDLSVGFVNGNGNVTVTMKPRGNWDWSSATVVANSIPVAAVSGAVAAASISGTGADLTALTSASMDNLSTLVGNGDANGQMIYWSEGFGQWQKIDMSGASAGQVLTLVDHGGDLYPEWV